jgi:hypothetical protein
MQHQSVQLWLLRLLNLELQVLGISVIPKGEGVILISKEVDPSFGRIYPNVGP